MAFIMEAFDLGSDRKSSPLMSSHTTEEGSRATVATTQSVHPSPSIVVSMKQHNNHSFQKWKQKLQKF